MNRRNLALGAAALATLVGGAALAQQGMGAMGRHDPFGDATVTRAEAQAKAAEMFGRMDLNHDGKLDQADRAAAMGARFDAMDANKDGALSKQEFIDAHQKMRAAMGAGRPEGGQMGGGMGHGMGGGMKHRGMGGMKMMAGMDANGDHALSRDEFLAGAMKRFDAADANKDGKLTPQERQAAFRQGMKMHRQHMGGMGGHDMADVPPPAAKLWRAR